MQTNSSHTQSSTEQLAVRTTTTTVWLWLVIVVNILVGILSLTALSSPLTLVSGVMSFAVATGAFLILRWKKIGFYIIVGCVAINIVLSILGGGSVGTAILSAILGVAIIYYVLQYPKENKAWSHLS